MKAFTKGHACMTHRLRQQCGDGQREEGRGREMGKGREGDGDICSSVNNENKVICAVSRKILPPGLIKE